MLNRIGSVSAAYETFRATAVYLPAAPGQFTLELPLGAMTAKVLALGPLVSTAAIVGGGAGLTPPTDTYADEYAWVIVCDPTGQKVSVSARDPDTFDAMYHSVVQAKLASLELGFSLGSAADASVDVLQPIFQSTAACNYSAVASQ